MKYLLPGTSMFRVSERRILKSYTTLEIRDSQRANVRAELERQQLLDLCELGAGLEALVALLLHLAGSGEFTVRQVLAVVYGTLGGGSKTSDQKRRR